MKAKNFINGEFFETENYLDAIDPSNLEVIGQGNNTQACADLFCRFSQEEASYRHCLTQR